MEELSKSIDFDEIQKLEDMYLGDKNRDASDKIRGFLFQDLVAINYLLDKETKYVCLEFLEDVDVFCSDGTLKFIQVKYYPKKNPIMKEIMTDLYYQYLRMEEFRLSFTKKPLLIIHREKKVTMPDLDKMKEYADCSKSEEPDIIENPAAWFKSKIYSSNKKEEQKKKLFEERAHENSVSRFLGDFDIIKGKNIFDYQEDVAEKLGKEFPESDIFEDDEDRKKILLGLALGYMQKRYTLEKPDFEQIIVEKKKFQQYILNIMNIQSEEHIAAYVRTVVGEQYITTIDENPQIETEKVNLLNHIAGNTQSWMSELAKTKEGQYQIINTVSHKNSEYVKGYMDIGIAERKLKMAECREEIESFLEYFWKIILNLCMNKVDFNMEKDKDMLRPQTYIDNSYTSYICIKFKEDFVDTSVILPAVSRGKKISVQGNICSRMYLEKPQKWFMEGETCGKKEYKYNVANISDGNSVMDVDEDVYYIECMECIKIDANQWDEIENCEKSIFAKNCVKGKEF
ncbi:MAG: hypothetical protein J6D02_10260 [Lachnospira sp.]|nr:hypothetical protein [Lachnospira sp.]